MSFLAKRFAVPDLAFFAVVLFLSGMGLVMVYSASSVVAWDRYQDSLYFLKRQGLFVLVGLALMLMVLSTDYHKWVRYSGYILLGSLIGLGLVLVPGIGIEVGGARRWIDLSGARIQPGEFAKLACVLYLSWALVRKGENVKTFTYGLLPMCLVAGVLAGLMLYQPDFGNAVILCVVTAMLLFLAGARVSYLVWGVVLAIPPLWWLVMGEAYRRKRMMTFLDPWHDPQNTSYQIIQSFTAFFSGGLWGNGLGNGKEKLYYLPEVHTDFIGAVVGEELGFWGVCVIVAAFLFLVNRGFYIAKNAPDARGYLLAAGCTLLIGLQAFLNLGVILGLLPTKGLPLPFLSHGGSSLITVFLACGFIQSVARASKANVSH